MGWICKQVEERMGLIILETTDAKRMRHTELNRFVG